MSRTELNPIYRPALEKLGLISYEAILRYFGVDPIPSRSGARVARHLLPGQPPLEVYFKHYGYRRPAWRFWGRASKARREYGSYHVFRRLGVSAPEPLAWAEGRDGLGRLRGALILTVAVTEAVTLETWLRTNAGSAARAQRREILAALAGQVRTLHASGFAHHDLVGRNLLVAPGPLGTHSLAWIDCPRGRFAFPPFVRRRQQVKDLAALDKTGVRHCSRTERLRFALRYLNRGRLDEATKRVVLAVIRYGRRRWPDDF